MIRPATQADIRAAAPLLRRAFASYRDALLYTPEVLDLFERLWWTPVHGRVAELDGELVGVAFVGHRSAELGETRVRVAHVGPVAVDPNQQGVGLGRALMAGLGEGVDLLTLTTNDGEGVRSFYEELGFTCLEHFVPWVRDLDQHSDDLPREPRPRERVLRELGPEAGRAFQRGEAGVRAQQWPVTSRRGGRSEELRTCQILSREGSGVELKEALGDACTWARSCGCEIVWARHDVGDGLPGFMPGGGAGVSRLVRAVTPLGRQVLDEARGYTPSSPAP